MKFKGNYALGSTISSSARTNTISKTHSAKTGIYFRFYVYFDTLPTGIAEVLIARVAFSSSRPMVSIYKDSTSVRWRLRDGGGTIRQYATGLSAQTWYCLELKAVVGDESALYLNGEKILTGTAPSNSSSSLWLLAYSYSGVPDGTTIYFDNVVASDNYIGPLNTTIPVTDSAALNEEQFASKAFTITEGLTLQEQASISNKLKPVLDTLKSVDGSPLVNKMLKVADDAYIIEVVEVGKGDRRTRLFLVMGNVAVKLTGYL